MGGCEGSDFIDDDKNNSARRTQMTSSEVICLSINTVNVGVTVID